MSSEQILKAAMALPAKSKAKLADKLLASLDLANAKKFDADWSHEFEGRIDAYEKGKIRSIPAAQVLRKLKSRKRR